jgi:hypothetical protein
MTDQAVALEDEVDPIFRATRAEVARLKLEVRRIAHEEERLTGGEIEGSDRFDDLVPGIADHSLDTEIDARRSEMAEEVLRARHEAGQVIASAREHAAQIQAAAREELLRVLLPAAPQRPAAQHFARNGHRVDATHPALAVQAPTSYVPPPSSAVPQPVPEYAPPVVPAYAPAPPAAPAYAPPVAPVTLPPPSPPAAPTLAVEVPLPMAAPLAQPDLRAARVEKSVMQKLAALAHIDVLLPLIAAAIVVIVLLAWLS